MSFSINVSLNGTFYFEINRTACGRMGIEILVKILRKQFSEDDGYKITAEEKFSHSTQLNI